MLSAMTASGVDYTTCLREAQALGYAEADPTADVEGYAARRKLVLSANHLSSGESMAQYAEAAGAQHIIIAASSEKGLRSHKGLDVQSTYKEGEIARQFKKE